MKYKVLAALALIATATPVWAVGVEDLAKVVLNGNSVLKKADTTCEGQASLSVTDNTVLDTAVDAAKRTLVPERFSILNSVANAQADEQAQSDTFCPDTKAKKPGLLSEIKKAGKKLLLKKIGF